MRSTELMGKTIRCECGKTHRLDPKELLYADDAAERMPQLCAKYAGADRTAAAIFDARTRAAAGQAVADALRGDGWSLREVLVADGPGGADPVCDEPTKNAVAAELGDVGLVVSVGGGVVSDLGKWCAFERDLPAVTFGTACSMNGYPSANVAAAQAGVKILVRARPPQAVAASPAVLRDAPFEMTASGLGDVLAKSVSSTDWRLNQWLFGDYYCPRCVGLIAEIEPLYLQDPRGIREGTPQACDALFDALLLTGMAMTMAETSDPSSGGEHLVSHTLDMVAMAHGEHHDLHGRQVGVGTVLTCELYRRVLAIDRPGIADRPQKIDREFWGPVAGEVESQFARKADRVAAAVGKLASEKAWEQLRAELAPMVRPPEVVRDCLRDAGAAWRAEDIDCSAEHLTRALVNARQMRGRFTILDLAWLTGVLPDAADEIVRQWAS